MDLNRAYTRSVGHAPANLAVAEARVPPGVVELLARPDASMDASSVSRARLGQEGMRSVIGSFLSVAMIMAAGGWVEAASSSAQQAQARAVFDRYCVACHNQRIQTAGLELDAADVSNVGERPDVWEKVVRKLRTGLMPPSGRPRPDRASTEALTAWLETELDDAAARSPNPGRTEAMHRLNRAEYQNAVRDLLGVEVDVASLLPVDAASFGFDNVAGVQRMSSTLMEGYLAAAQKVSRLALGRPVLFPDAVTFTVPDALRQDDRLDGLPFGSRGGMSFEHVFQTDGMYTIQVRLARKSNNSEDVPEYDQPQELEIGIDGRRVTTFTLAARRDGTASSGTYAPSDRRHLDADWEVRVPVSAGPRQVTATFLNRVPALMELGVRPFLRPYPDGGGAYTTRKGAYLHSVEIRGPFDQTGPGDTPSRRRIFICRPESPDDEPACARKILSVLARRAHRRPVTETDVAPLLDFFEQGRADDGFEAGIERALQVLLVSPQFLFRFERDPLEAPQGSNYQVSDLALASRLSFFLWSSIPDDELLDVAIAGQLSDPPVLERQVRRMVADPRSDALVKNFGGQWLFLRNIPSLKPARDRDPDFDEDLRVAFRRETELFLRSTIREDRSAIELLTADYTFVNERLARHYGFPNVYGGHFRRVSLPDETRRGLLGHGSILSVTSYPHRTSPVVRGKWILENILGTPPPPPPPDVPALVERKPLGEVLTVRQRMSAHRANPVCASCHSMMDPLGFALENYDFVGRWRTHDESFIPVDASGVLPDGTPFEGVAGLRRALVDHPEWFVTTLTEKLLTYALGRGLEYYDVPAIRRIVHESGPQYRLSSLLTGIVRSLPFQMRRVEEGKRGNLSIESVLP